MSDNVAGYHKRAESAESRHPTPRVCAQPPHTAWPSHFGTLERPDPAGRGDLYLYLYSTVLC